MPATEVAVTTGVCWPGVPAAVVAGTRTVYADGLPPPVWVTVPGTRAAQVAHGITVAVTGVTVEATQTGQTLLVWMLGQLAVLEVKSRLTYCDNGELAWNVTWALALYASNGGGVVDYVRLA